VDGELADDGLAGPRGRGHQDALAALERLAPADLEVVAGEVVGNGEAGGTADAAYLYETGRACLALGKRDEGGAYLSRALAAEPDTRKVRELMELIQ